MKLSSRQISLLSLLCCGQAWQVNPRKHIGSPAILVTSSLDEIGHHVVDSHIRELGDWLKLDSFGDTHSVPWCFSFPKVLTLQRIDPRYNGIIVILTEHPFIGRIRLGLCKQFPYATVLCRGYSSQYGFSQMTFRPDSWHNEKLYCTMVWHEFLLIAELGNAGVIAYPLGVRRLVEKILYLSKND